MAMTTYSISTSAASATPSAPASNSRRGGHPNDKQLSDVISWLVADLKAIDQLRRDELQKLNRLRAEVYQNAREAV
jgi:hypothetical protein